MQVNVLITLVVAFGVGIASCDSAGAPGGQLREGQRLDVVRYAAAEQPTSRAGYAGMGVFAGYGSIHLFDPGTGTSDPPRLVRSIRLPNLLPQAAQVDHDGYVWVAVPDHSVERVHRAAYVVDPHAATVHRVVALAEEVRAAADLVIGPERVYLYAWRNGFSGGVGTVDRGCVADRTRCGATLFSELGNVGSTPERAFHLSDRWLYVASNMNSRDQRRALNKIDLATGQIVATSPNENDFAFDDRSLYTVGYLEPGAAYLVRLDRETLAETGRDDASLIAREGSSLYVSDYQSNTVQVRSTETLEVVRTFNVSASGGVLAPFGFVAPGVLMLNGAASLNVATGKVLLDPAREQAELGFGPNASRMPEGHPLAY